MTEEEKNIKKRKNESLTDSEWLTFFFFPLKSGRTIGSETKSFNEIEDERFEKFGFDKKKKQSADAQGYGCLFYFLMFLAFIFIKIILIN